MHISVRQVLEILATYPDRRELLENHPDLQEEDLQQALAFAATTVDGMIDSIIEEKAPIRKTDEWADRIAAQQRSGVSVKQFCKEQGLTEGSFYAWRKRLQKKEPIRFALVDRGGGRQG